MDLPFRTPFGNFQKGTLSFAWFYFKKDIENPCFQMESRFSNMFLMGKIHLDLIITLCCLDQIPIFIDPDVWK